jgi:hypothetical protein
MAPVFRLLLALCLAASLAACRRRETAEATRARAAETFLKMQIADLEALVAKAEAGGLVTRDRIAIGVSEDTAKALLDASLPREQALGQRLRLRIEAAQPYFRGNNAGLAFQATARGVATGATARLELGGRLVDFRIEAGKLSARVDLGHFKVLGSSLPDIGSDAIEGLVRDNLDALERMVPGLDVPVRLEQSIAIPGLDEGVVQARAGVLPLAISLAEVVPVNKRLWVLLDAKAGPWQRSQAAGKGR